MKQEKIEKKKTTAFSLYPSTVVKLRRAAHKKEVTASLLLQGILDNSKELKA